LLVMGVSALRFEDILRVTESSRIGPGEFLFKELSSRTVQQVLMTLSVAHLHAIPVFNTQQASYSMYGLRDLLQCLLDIVEGVDPRAPVDPLVATRLKNSLAQKLKVSVSSLLTEKPQGKFVAMDLQHSLYDVVHNLIENNHTEVSITTDKDVLLNVINLETIVRFIYVHRMRMHPKYFTATAGELGLGLGKVPLFTINENDPVFYGFKIIHQEKVPCVAVLDEAQGLVGCINLSDLHVIFKPKRSILDLFMPANKFIELGSCREEWSLHPTRPAPPAPRTPPWHSWSTWLSAADLAASFSSIQTRLSPD